MLDNASDLDHDDESILAFEVTDATLEAAAATSTHAAFSLVGAPTVSILVACCNA